MKRIIIGLIILMGTMATVVRAAVVADNKNYFTEWNCTSPVGIDAINKLDILPLGSHSPRVWKDSLWVNGVDTGINQPNIFFSLGNKWGDTVARTSWTLQKAVYREDLEKWVVTKTLENTANDYGISSQDGTSKDYIMNEYDINGWGPTANKPGSLSKIPGVAEDRPEAPLMVGYPLYGSGPLGLTTIKNMVYYSPPEYIKTETCLHMNPTLFDYDGEGVPHSFMAYLFYSRNGARLPCKLPGSETTLPIGYYIYRYNSTNGWQLDVNTGVVLRQLGDSAINYIWGSPNRFITQMWEPTWGGRIGTFSLEEKPAGGPILQAREILNCDAFLGEPSGTDDWFYVVGSPSPGSGTAAGLEDGVSISDIYVAYNSNKTNPFKAPPTGSLSCTPSTLNLTENQLGTAEIRAVTDNIATGVAQICVEMSGQPKKEMVTIPGTSASKTIAAPWIEAGKDYTFTLFQTSQGGVCSGTVLASCMVSTTKILGDTNDDGKVNLVDFSLWKQEYSKKVTTKKADFNNDGIVNLVDFSIWKREYLKQ